MYIKTKDKKLFEEIDNLLSLPAYWNHFINNLKKEHNLIIKCKNQYICTHCNNVFESNIHINDICKCPYCKKEYLVKSYKLKDYYLTDQFGVLDRFENHYIMRYFEIKTYFTQQAFKKFNLYSDICEYGRKIYDNNFYEEYEIINDHIHVGIGYTGIYHDSNLLNSQWRYFNSFYRSLGSELIIYPYNLKQLFKNTKWQYSNIWVLAKKIKYFDCSYLLRNYFDSVELLVKLKLYNLALCPKTFNKRGSFEKRFGVTKDYYPFIKKYNLNLDELFVLQKIKVKDIKAIKYLSKFQHLNDLSKFINIYYAYKYTDISIDNEIEYLDYLRFMKELNYNMNDKKMLYPKNIKNYHDKLQKLVEIKKNEKIISKIKIRDKQLKNMCYRNNQYLIFPAPSMESLIEESQQQNNCVKTYAEKYANSECDIYFMRLVSSPMQSLVTVEVRNKKIVQKRIKNNELPTINQCKFLDYWESNVLNGKK